MLSTNTESNGRFHTDWLNMMYARLKLSRNLLTDDGVIFISIDDSEQSNLKQISDGIYGENNFIGTIIRNTNSTKTKHYSYRLVMSIAWFTLRILIN